MEEELLRFTIPGNPVTKKTHQRIMRVGGYPRIFPSKQYEEYEKYCKQFCLDVWKNQGKDPMKYGVAIKIKVWLSRWILPDHVGILQSIGDILEKWGVIENDKYIHWTDFDPSTGEREHWFQGIDKENPRIEILIFRYKHLYEDYTEEKDTKEAAKLERKKAREEKKLGK
jgi:Holliday junction resolvase RusA-like endonuclease